MIKSSQSMPITAPLYVPMTLKSSHIYWSPSVEVSFPLVISQPSWKTGNGRCLAVSSKKSICLLIPMSPQEWRKTSERNLMTWFHFFPGSGQFHFLFKSTLKRKTLLTEHLRRWGCNHPPQEIWHLFWKQVWVLKEACLTQSLDIQSLRGRNS